MDLRLIEVVRALEGKSKAGRREALIGVLKKSKIGYKNDEYVGGVNFFAEIKGTTRKKILFTTHYDAVPGSPGANDNASSIAVLVELYKRLRKRKFRHSLLFCFFDQEEIGNVGAREWLRGRERGVEDVVAVLDSELCGIGNMVGVWPTKEIEGSSFLATIEKALKKKKVPYECVQRIPLFWGSYLAFRRAGVRNAICFTVAPRAQREDLLRFVQQPAWLATMKMIVGALKMPEFFKHYHSAQDRSEFLSERAMKLMVKAFEAVVVEVDKKFGGKVYK